MSLFTTTLRAAASMAAFCLLTASVPAAAQTPPTPAPTPAPTQQSAAQQPAPVKPDPAPPKPDSAPPPVDPSQTPTAAPKPKEAKADQPASQFSGLINAVGLVSVKGPDGKPIPAKAANFDQIIFAPDGAYPPLEIAVVTAPDKAALALSADKRTLPVVDGKPQPNADLKKRDHILIDVDNPVNPTKIVKIVEIQRPVSGLAVGLTILAVTAGLLALAYLASGGRPSRFITGHDGRISNSQFQLALWFGVVAVAYGSMLALRVSVLGVDFIGGIGLTPNVLMLTGLSALTFGGAKLVTTAKQSAEANQAAEKSAVAAKTAESTAGAAQTLATAANTLDPADPAAVKANAAASEALASAAYSTSAAVKLAGAASVDTAAAPAKTVAEVRPSYLDLFRNGDGETDLGDFQMVLISVVAAGIFLVSSIHAMLMLEIAADIVLPDVDSALLATFGLGQGAYLAKKAVLPLNKG